MESIDLIKFCDKNIRAYKTPFSIEDFTYATNGKIAVRVPLIEGIEKANQETNPMNICEMFNDINWDFERINLSPIVIPPSEAINDDCMCDNGIIGGHDCPTCFCERPCEYCEGTGVVRIIKSQTVNIGKVPFDSYYLEMIMGLKNPMIPTDTKQSKAMPFVFDGGCGILMPLREGTSGEIKSTR